jgi:hypothetical protein
MPQQSTLSDYYRRLLIWEEQPFQELVHKWPGQLAEQIIEDFRQAFTGSNIKETEFIIPAGTSNQSVGNKVEGYFVDRVAPLMRRFQLSPCSGHGYPDRMLLRGVQRIPMEVKATSKWDEADSNRRVLTSSSTKLRSQFVAPIYHLLSTIHYRKTDRGVRITGLRLDFLEPSTPVNIRLEASVSHRILFSGEHRNEEL